MALVNCPECGREISDKAVACPHCAYPMAHEPDAPAEQPPEVETTAKEMVLLVDHPSMFRNHPIWFSLCILLVPVVGVGLIILFFWFLVCKATELTITDERTILRQGLFSKRTNEIRHSDVKNIQVTQSFLQRMFNVGRLAVSSAGQDTIEIEVNGVYDPQGIADLLRVRQ